MAASEPVDAADPTQQADEELVLEYQHGSHLAGEVLFGRYRKAIDRRAGRLARRLGQAEKIADAQQEGVVAFFKALSDYQPHQTDKAELRPFAPFLWTVCRRHLLNFIRGVKREAEHAAGSPDVGRVLEFGLERVRKVIAWPEALVPALSNPFLLALSHDFCEKVEELIDQLGPRARQVWDGWLTGATLKEIAGQLGISLRTVQRWLGRIKKRLVSRFGEPND
jgi:RNA polymerase sigma factor (sigma-70 family)